MKESARRNRVHREAAQECGGCLFAWCKGAYGPEGVKWRSRFKLCWLIFHDFILHSIPLISTHHCVHDSESTQSSLICCSETALNPLWDHFLSIAADHVTHQYIYKSEDDVYGVFLLRTECSSPCSCLFQTPTQFNWCVCLHVWVCVTTAMLSQVAVRAWTGLVVGGDRCPYQEAGWTGNPAETRGGSFESFLECQVLVNIAQKMKRSQAEQWINKAASDTRTSQLQLH